MRTKKGNHSAICITVLVLLMRMLCVQSVRSQDTTKIEYGRLAVVGGITTGFVVGNHIYQQKAWWQGNRAPFHFQNDWDYALNFDKWGHMYATSLVSKLFASSLEWGNVGERASTFYGSLLGLSYELYIELEDGYHANYGFSPGDASADILGATYPILQMTFPVLKNFQFKWSYFPSKKYLDDIKNGQSRVFTDDYDGQINWITMDPHFLLSDELSRNVPAWLGVGLGWSVRDLDGMGGGRRIYYLALDYNFLKIETSSSFLRSVFWVLDIIHWPAPGLALDRKKVKVGFFF